MILRPIITFCFYVSFLFAPLSASALASQNHFQLNEIQRQQYLNAKTSLENGDIAQYESLKQKLSNYALLPYLEYQELNKKLKNYPYAEVDLFLENNKGSYLGKLLLRNWLSQLASDRRWHEYRSYFSTSQTSTAHRCLFIWSKLQTGDKEALKDVKTLWNVGKSQPDECDPVFKQWQQAGYLSEDLVWSRYLKASIRRNERLKRYLVRLMSVETKSIAKQFQAVLKSPSLLETTLQYKKKHPYMQDLVVYGLNKYIRGNSSKAWDLWQSYSRYFQFSSKQSQQFIYKLAKRHAFDAESDRVKQYLIELDQEQQVSIIEIVIREELQRRNWQEVDRWITRLPREQQQTERWQYWQARTNEVLGRPKEQFLPIYSQLAETRSFYGFLSADYLGQDYKLQHSPTIVEAELRKMLEMKPGIVRARELFFLGKLNDARQEWSYATRKTDQPLTPEAHQAVAKLAYEWGWHRKSIESMAAASAWDDLSIRFPVAHKTIIQRQAQKTNLPSTLLFAIARQESAWETDARSSAGAMGLMQLMPRTAKETARKAGISHRRDDLFEPEHNIALGSRYIGELLAQYDNNRVPAIAAYNAGPHRVNKWLKQTDSRLPYDVWIEVIPFGETRKYVQNVLAYSVVYSHQIGANAALLTQVELNRPL